MRVLRSLARSFGAQVKNPKWTSYGAIEVDVFTRSREDFSLLETAISPLMRVEFSHYLEEPPQFLPDKDTVELARSYFNAERFWECHEVLEGMWRRAGGDEKSLLQGIILVAAAYVHGQKDELQVAIGILRRASPKIRWSSRYYYGIDLDALRLAVSRAIKNRRLELFRI
jgi:hypothetical protein